MTAQRIIIIGGGFAGVACAKTLRKRFSRDQCEILIFNRENHMVFHPLLAEVAGGSINQDAVAAHCDKPFLGPTAERKMWRRSIFMATVWSLKATTAVLAGCPTTM